MKLSTKGRYGLRAMIDLASHEEEGAVSIASISERQNISESYLEPVSYTHLRIQHFVCRSQISLFYYTHMHFTHGDQAVQQVRLSFRVRLMNDTFVAFTCGTRFVGIDTRDDDQFVGYFVGNLCQTVIVLQNSVFVVCGARSYDCLLYTSYRMSRWLFRPGIPANIRQKRKKNSCVTICTRP